MQEVHEQQQSQLQEKPTEPATFSPEPIQGQQKTVSQNNAKDAAAEVNNKAGLEDFYESHEKGFNGNTGNAPEGITAENDEETKEENKNEEKRMGDKEMMEEAKKFMSQV